MLTNIIEQLEGLVLRMEPHRSVRFLNAAPAIISSAAPASNASSVDGDWIEKPLPSPAVGVT